MSGSIGGKRIKRAEVQPTLDNYIEKVLKGFPGFVSAQITGSYNAGTRADHGDIDIAVHIKGNDVKTVKKNFKAYLDSLSDDLTPRFVFGRNEGKKAQLYGAIVTCGFPINGRPEDYVQIDNIIVTNENEQRFQREFLDLDAAKQGLVMGLIRVILHHKNADKILDHIGLADLPKLSGNQEYEFVLSSAGLSFRRVTLGNDMREVSRDELWRSANWDLVEYILSDFNLKQSYEELLEQVAKMVKNNERSRRRIVGIMKSMIKVGPGEVGTPKGIGKENAIKLAAETLNVFESVTLKEYIMENMNFTKIEDLKKYLIDEIEKADESKLDILNSIRSILDKGIISKEEAKSYFIARDLDCCWKTLIDIFTNNNDIESLRNQMLNPSTIGINEILKGSNIFKVFDGVCKPETAKALSKLIVPSKTVNKGAYEVFISTFIKDMTDRNAGQGDINVSNAAVEIKAPLFRVHGSTKLYPSTGVSKFNNIISPYTTSKIDNLLKGKKVCDNIIDDLSNIEGITDDIIYRAFAECLVYKHSQGTADMVDEVVKFFANNKNKFNADLIFQTSIVIDLYYYQMSEKWDYMLIFKGKNLNSSNGDYVVIPADFMNRGFDKAFDEVTKLGVYATIKSISTTDDRSKTCQVAVK